MPVTDTVAPVPLVIELVDEAVPDAPDAVAPGTAAPVPAYVDDIILYGNHAAEAVLEADWQENMTLYTVAPVFRPSVNDSMPAVFMKGAEHEYPGTPMQAVAVTGLKTFSENRAARTTAIIRIAHPYVMRYSMALCALEFLFLIFMVIHQSLVNTILTFKKVADGLPIGVLQNWPLKPSRGIYIGASLAARSERSGSMISLRPVLMQDCTDIFEGIRNGGLSGSVPGSDHIRNIKDASAMVADLIERAKAGRELHFSVCLEGGKVIGMCAIYGFDEAGHSARIGFWVNKRYRREGYGKEAARLLLDIAFGDLRIRRIIASSDASNEPSLRLLRSLGFEEDGRSQAVQNGEKLLSLSKWKRQRGAHFYTYIG